MLSTFLAIPLASGQQFTFAIADKITGLGGTWTRDPSRGAGGICGISEADTRSFELQRHDRSELTLWRTLNVRMPDGSSGKIDCGNRAAVVYRRQANP